MAEPGVPCRRSQDKLLENFVLRSHPADKSLEMPLAVERQSRQRADFQLRRDLEILLDVHREDEHLSPDFRLQLFQLTGERTASATAGFPELDEHRHRRPGDDRVELAIRDLRDHRVGPG